MTVTINNFIAAPKSDVFRRAYIKRRLPSTANYESGWLEITSDVKSFGKITKQMDYARRNKFTQGALKLTVNNEDGRYNDSTVESSQWFGFLNQQRTLFKISAGFYGRTKNTASGIWRNITYPGDALWDISEWDADDAQWDAQSSSFIGILVGDVMLSDSNQISFNIKPLTTVFEDFPARNLSGWTTTGMTASQFVTMVRDQVDVNGNYIFRPFFGDTTTFWDIGTTSQVYSSLNTSTSQGVFDKSVWEVMEKLAEAENYIPYVSSNGTFKFVSRDVSATTAFEFHGAGSFSTTYGHTIKSISSYGEKLTKYYSRVEMKFRNEDTTSSYQIVEGSYSVSPLSNAWVLGQRIMKIENLFLATSTVANTIATNIFNEVSDLKKEIEFTTSFIPHLEILDRVTITYDPTEFLPESLWDLKNWGDDTVSISNEDMVWDSSKGDAIILEGNEFRFLSIEVDLDNLGCKFIAREA